MDLFLTMLKLLFLQFVCLFGPVSVDIGEYGPQLSGSHPKLHELRLLGQDVRDSRNFPLELYEAPNGWRVPG